MFVAYDENGNDVDMDEIKEALMARNPFAHIVQFIERDPSLDKDFRIEDYILVGDPE